MKRDSRTFYASLLLMLMMISNLCQPVDSRNGKLTTANYSVRRKKKNRKPRRNLQDNCRSVPAESHFIVDLIGFPLTLDENDLDELSSSFIRAYNGVRDTTGCVIVTSAEVTTSLISSIPTTSIVPDQNARGFPVSMTVTGFCRGCQGQLLEGLSADTAEDGGCASCSVPTRNQVLARWQLEYDSSSSDAINSIFDLTELALSDDAETCNPSTFTRFGTNVVVGLRTTTPEGLSESNLQDLSTVFRESYKAKNELNSDKCDPMFRSGVESFATVIDDLSQHVNLSNITETSDSTLVYVDFYVGGLCDGCDPSTNLFDTIPSPSSGSRRELSESNQTSCLCPSGGSVEQRGPTKQEFLIEFIQESRDLIFVNEIIEINEVDPIECSDDIIDFVDEQVLLDVGNICNTSLPDADIDEILKAFVMAYNELAETMCDPHLRIVDSANLTRRSSDDTADTLTLELSVSGRCRGCDTDADSIIYAVGGSGETPPVNALSPFKSLGREVVSKAEQDPNSRRQRRVETCYCDTTATKARAPTEAEFINYLSSYLSSRPPLSCVGSIPQCNFGSAFQTAIVASFANDTNMEEFSLAMEAAFTRSIRSFYQTSAQSCNSEFRVFESVDTTIGVPFQPRDFGLPVDRRELTTIRQQRMVRGLQTGTTNPTFAPSPIPSTAPSLIPSFIDTDTYILFYSNGICNGCQGLPIISPTAGQTFPSGDALASSSQCSCPVDASKMTGPYASASFESVFQTELDMESVPFEVRNIYETDVTECTGAVQDFQSDIRMMFSFNSSLTQRESRALSSLVKETYNNLSNQYCDPLMRSVDSLSIESTTPVDITATCSEFQLVFTSSGKCQGCENNTALLDDTIAARRGLLGDVVPEGHRKLRFVGDDICFCDQSAVASRAPSPQEFEAALIEALNNDSSFAKVCSVSVPPQNVETLAPTSSPTEEVCNVTLPDQLSSRVIVTVQGPDDEVLSTEQLEAIAGAVRTTYNTIIGLRYTPCDLQYRLVSNVTVDAEFSAPSDTLAFIVEVDCQGCAVDSDFFDPTVIPRANFETVYIRNAQQGNFSITGVREIDLRTCPSDTGSEFSRVVRVEFTQLPCMDGLNFTGTEPQLRSVEKAFVSAYNNLVLSYCDPFYRTLEQAQIVRFGENTDEGNLPVEIRVTGSCRNGCNPNLIDVYAIPNSMPGARMLLEESVSAGLSHRFLQETETCFCDSQAIGARAPFESEFVAQYRKAVEALDLECLSSVGQCEFGTRFSTGIVVLFDQDDLLESGNLTATIEDTFLQTINTIYDVDDESCNPEFRMIDSVQATIGVNLTAVDSMAGQRYLRSLQMATDFPTMSPTTAFVAGNPNPAPTLPPDIVILPDGPTSSPTTVAPPGSLAVLLYIAGTCNGCSDDFALSNQVVSGRRRLPARELQAGSFNSSSNCFCPIEATRQTGIDADEVTQSFQSALDGEVNLTVNEIDEITVVECLDELREYETFFAFDFAVKDSITDREIDDLVGLIASTYNELNAAYCDPFLREIDVLLVADGFRVRRRRMQEGNLEDGCFRLDIEFEAYGSCRGCEDFIDLFSEASFADSRRRELSEYVLDPTSVSRGRRRGLQEFPDICFCEGQTIASRAPTIDEFAIAFEPKLEALQLPNVCAFFGAAEEFCDIEENGDEYEGEVAVSLVVEGDLGEDDIFNLKETFFDTFNREVDSFLDVCDEDYTQLYFVFVDDVIFEFESSDLSFLTVVFVFFGFCQIDGPCDGEIVFDVIDDINNQFERLVAPVIAAGVGEEIFGFFGT